MTRKKGSAKQDCPLQKGIVCIVVSRADDNKAVPNVQVSLTGPTAGKLATDTAGIAQFDDRLPGAYEFGISLPSTHAAWTILAYTPQLSVAANQISMADVFVYPAGDLAVEIYDDRANSLLATVVPVKVTGPQPAGAQTAGGKHSFKALMSGDYTVSITVPEGFVPPEQAAQVTVPDGGTVTATFRLKRWTWIALSLYDTVAAENLKATLKLKLLDGSEVTRNLDAGAPLREQMILADGACTLSEVEVEGDDLYQVIGVDSS
jgi:hypothetical protein